MKRTRVTVLAVATKGFAEMERFKNQAVTSSAGCGKTTRLVNEYLERVKRGVSPSNILAITFTNLAAAEMKERVIEKFKEELKEEWQKFSRGELQLRISTIHSFLADLLVRYSLEMGLNPAFEVVTGKLAEELWVESLDEELENLFLSGEASKFDEILKTFGLSLTKKILIQAYSLRPATDVWAASEQEKILSIESSLSNEKKIALLFSRVLERFQRKKGELGIVDFADLEIMVLNFLSSNPDYNRLLLFFNEHFYHLLVDEFQDTSLVQWQIIERMVGDWLSGAGLREVYDNSLFLVGDAKQSIYRFRGAEVGVFKKVVDEFSSRAKGGGEEHYLPTGEERYNRRSTRKIIEFINWFFPRLEGEVEVEDSFVYQEFLPVREKEGLVEACFFISKSEERVSKEVRVEREAFWVVERIVDLIGSNVEIEDKGQCRPIRFSDIAIIMRNATHSIKFEQELKKRGLPYYVRKGKDFYRQPEVSFLVQALNFVANEANDLALFSLLRSPVFAYQPEEIVRVMRNSQPFLWEKIKEDKGFSLATEVFSGWLKKKGKSPTELAEFILESSGAFSVFNLPSQIFNLEKFFLLLSQLELKGLSNVESAVYWLEKAEADEEGEAEVSTENSIRILTVHSSKGLEFPAVFVVLIDDFGSNKKNSNWFFLESEAKKFEYRALIKPLKVGSEDEFFRLWSKREQEEEKRLLYVALTRARDFLFLTGGGTDKEINKADTIFSQLFKAINQEKSDLISRFNPKEKNFFQESISCPKGDLVFLIDKLEDQPDFKKGEPATDEVTLTSLEKEEKVIYGEVFHRLLEWFSRESKKGSETSELLNKAYFYVDRSLLAPRLKRKLKEELLKLRLSGLLEEIVLYQPSLEEKPFFSVKEKIYFERRLDKILFKDKEIWLVDYKTEEVEDNELKKVVNLYKGQLMVYKKLASQLYTEKKVRTFLLFTSLAKLLEI